MAKECIVVHCHNRVGSVKAEYCGICNEMSGKPALYVPVICDECNSLVVFVKRDKANKNKVLYCVACRECKGAEYEKRLVIIK